MDLQADTVTDRMTVLLTIPGLPDRLPGGTVDLAAGHPCPDSLHAGLLGSADQLVDLTEPGRGRAERHRPGHARVVPVHDAAEVGLDEVPGAERPVHRPVVRLGAVL